MRRRIPLMVTLAVASLVTICSLALSWTMAAPVGYAQADEMVLDIGESEEQGEYLTYSDHPVYMFTPDSADVSACYDTCAENWPPVTVEDVEDVMLGDMLDSTLVDTITREDDSQQLTYNGHPLYYFVADENMDTPQGNAIESFGGEWYLLNAEGEAVEADGRTAAATPAATTPAMTTTVEMTGTATTTTTADMEVPATLTSTESITPTVVLEIGDRSITQDEFNEQFMSVIRSVAAQRGIPINEETVQLFEGMRAQYLDYLATQESLLLEAGRRGLDEDIDEAVDLQIEEIRQQFADDEEFEQALREAGFADIEALREFTQNNALLERLTEELSAEIDVTDEDIQEYYEENVDLFTTPDGETIPLEQIGEQVRQQILNERLQEAAVTLREGANVQIYPERLTPFDYLDDEEVNDEEVETEEVETEAPSEGDSLTGPLVDLGSIATAELTDAEGNYVGVASFETGEDGVQIHVDLTGLVTDPGLHGIHIHETGACEPDFSAAGGHFNPADADHGLLSVDGPHAGDLPNIMIDADGNAVYDVTSNLISLRDGARAILDEDGSALIIHEGADDYITDPAGDSGDRIACGVIMAEDEVTE